MPNVFPDDILRRLRELEKKVGIGPATEDVDIPFFTGSPTDAQILIYQVPGGPTPPPAWAAVTVSGDATITDQGVVTVAGGASGFPITYNDGTYTYSITATGGDLKIFVFKDATPTVITIVDFDATTGDLNENVRRDWNEAVANDINISYGHDINVTPVAFGNPGRDINVTAKRDLNLLGIATANIDAPAIGFHGVAAVAQAAHPVTLGDVITLLTNLGLCA